MLKRTTSVVFLVELFFRNHRHAWRHIRMCLFRLSFIKIRYKVILPVYVLITYFCVYRYAYLFWRDRLSTLSIQ